MARTNAQGFIASGQEIREDDLNSLISQWGDFNGRPTASSALEGLEYVVSGDSDDDLNGRRYQVRNGSWVELPTGSDIDSLETRTISRDDYTSFANVDEANNYTRKQLISALLALTRAGDISSGIFPFARGGTGQGSASAASAALLGIHSVQLVTSSTSYTPTSTVQVTAVASTTGGVTITRGTDEIVVMHDPDEGQFGLVLESTDTVSVDSGYAILSLVV